MSDTPRTDAAETRANASTNPYSVLREHARDLERKLAEAMDRSQEDWGALTQRSEAAEAKLAALQAKPDVAGLVRRLCMSKLFDAPELTAERKEAADALLSLSAQLQEKEAECNAKTEVLLEAQRIAAQAQAECEGLRQDAAFCMVF